MSRVTSDSDGLLFLLQAEPTLLPPAPDDWDAPSVYLRRLGEVHPCVRCGERATYAHIAATDLGPRWLDLCGPCVRWLQRHVTADFGPVPGEDEPKKRYHVAHLVRRWLGRLLSRE